MGKNKPLHKNPHPPIRKDNSCLNNLAPLGGLAILSLLRTYPPFFWRGRKKSSCGAVSRIVVGEILSLLKKTPGGRKGSERLKKARIFGKIPWISKNCRADRQNISLLRPYRRFFLKKSRYGISTCLLYTSPSPRDRTRSRMPSSA